VILAELGLLERTEGGGVSCPYTSMHIDMYMQAAWFKLRNYMHLPVKSL